MFLFLDTETAGLSPPDRIVSICWALYDPQGQEVSIQYHVIYPDGFDIRYRAVNIHGIATAKARRDGIPAAQALSQFSADIARFTPELLVCHNVSFDRSTVLNEYRLLPTKNGLMDSFPCLPIFCTMLQTVHICRIPNGKGGFKRPTLQELHRHLLDGPYSDPHHAMHDVRPCARCFFELRSGGNVSWQPTFF